MTLKTYLLKLSRFKKQVLAAFTDFFVVSFSVMFSIYLVSRESFVHSQYWISILISFVCIFILYLMGVYRSVLRYIDLTSFQLILKSILILFLIIIVIKTLIPSIHLADATAEMAIILLLTLMSGALIISSRLIANKVLSNEGSPKKVVIYGAGSAGIQLAGALRVSSEITPVAFIDANSALHGTFIGDLKVFHPKKLRKMITRSQIDEVLIAIPSAPKSVLRDLLEEIKNFSIKVRILPGLTDLAQGRVLVSELKEIDSSDLLGRFEVEANQALINKNIQNKVVLVTGAGGSIGSEISRQVIKNKPSKVIILDSNEYALYSIKNELESSQLNIELHSVLGSINNKKRITEVCKTFKVDTIYHAAAYKHVPLVEENPFEAVSNNIIGTKVCAEVASETGVETFVLISTDKAVRPTNIMGATKRFAELILQSLALNSKTRMIMVRFGNVIGSSGSAIPLFQKQIKDGGPVTVTHPDVIRYFMSIPEAAELVIQAGAMGKGGDVFVLDMGEPVKIYELARRLINLSGMEVKDEKNPDGDIEIVFTGLRPGEKLYEELLIGDNVSTTEHKKILRAEEEFLEPNELDMYLDSISEAEKNGDVVALRNILKDVVSGFRPEKEIVDIVYLQKNNRY